jgi:predicted nucleic acid-binding protein
MVAAICTWHEHHPRAVAEIARRLRQRERMVVAAPALVEAYAVLTRLPPPHRLSPANALTLLEANFMKGATVVALPARSYRDLLRRAPPEGIAGGRTYDAVIAECVRRTRDVTLLTFNAADFQPFVSRGLDVVVPRSS